MEHVVRLLNGPAHDLQIRDAPLDEGNLVAHSAQVIFLAARRVIQDDDAMSAADEFFHRIRADEAGAARHQVAHGGFLLGRIRLWSVAAAAMSRSPCGRPARLLLGCSEAREAVHDPVLYDGRGATNGSNRGNDTQKI